jgi:hypothetical protein
MSSDANICVLKALAIYLQRGYSDVAILAAQTVA